MNSVACYYFVTASGRSPVKEFVDALDPKSQSKFFFEMHLLEEFGRRLAEPHAKYLGDNIFELRFSGYEGAIRVLYFFFNGNKAIFTNGFIKKSNKTPRGEKELALKRKQIYLLSQR